MIYTTQLCEIKAFLFLQDPLTCTMLLYQTKLFFHGRFHLCIAFFFLFACSSFWLWDLCFAITFCLPAFDKLVEHINLIQYSSSVLWNCFYTISPYDWIRISMSFIFSNISSVPLGLNLIIKHLTLFAFVFIFIYCAEKYSWSNSLKSTLKTQYYP